MLNYSGRSFDAAWCAVSDGDSLMPSIRNDIHNALVRRRMPAFAAGSLRDLGGKLGLANPISLRTLDETVNGLPLATKVFSSGPITSGYVHGFADLGIQSDGRFSFRGQVHEAGAVGDNYLFAVALLDIKDPSGNALCFPQEGWLAGQWDFGRSDDPFQNDDFNQLLADQWDTILNSRPDRVEFRLHTSTNPWQVMETVVIGMFVVGVAVLGVYGASRCEWHTEERSIDPATGEERGGGFVCYPSKKE